MDFVCVKERERKGEVETEGERARESERFYIQYLQMGMRDLKI